MTAIRNRALGPKRIGALGALLLAALCAGPRAQGVASTQFGSLDKQHLPRDLQDARELACGDLDGDGDLDLIVATGTERLVLLEQTEHARFVRVPAKGLWTAGSECLSVCAADLDGDRDVDLITLSRQTSVSQGTLYTLQVWLQSAPFTFGGNFGLHHSPTPRNRVQLFDVDSDRDLDLVIACGVLGQPAVNELWLNDGQGKFTPQPNGMPQQLAATSSFAPGDFDGDGGLELVACVQGPNQLLEWNGQNAMALQSSSRWPAYNAHSNAAIVADIDADSDLDVVVANGRSSQPERCSYYLNDGIGNFQRGNLTPASFVATSVLAFDADNDGDPDLVLIQGDEGCDESLRQDRFLRNVSKGAYADQTSQWLPREVDAGTSGLVADLDGDGDQDIVLAHRDGPLRLWLRPSQGPFLDASGEALARDRDEAHAAVAGDIDGDGRLDLVVANSGRVTGEPLRVLRNDGYGLLQRDDAAIPATAITARDLVLFDADLDGDLDLFVAALGNPGVASPNTLLLNDGQGGFSPAPTTALPADRDRSYAVAVGDLDLDGDEDLMVANGAYVPGLPGGQSRVYLSDGRGKLLAAPMALPAQLWDATDVALGDVDADGDLDAVFACRPLWDAGTQSYAGGRTRLLLGDGQGGFSDVSTTQLPLDAAFSTRVALLDVDGDGDLDLFVANGGTMPPLRNHLYLNDGSGRFSDVSSTHLPPESFEDIALAHGDVDEDGHVDLVLGNGETTRLLLGTASGRFVPAPEGRLLPDGGDPANALLLFDFDDDQDLDLWSGRNGPDALRVNFARQIRAPYIEQIGTYTPIFFHARSGYAPLGQVVMPFVSYLEALPPAPIPPWGEWRVGLTGMQFFFVLPIDPVDGALEFPLWVPPLSNLIGSRFYMQALVAHGPQQSDWRFTSLWSEVLVR
jgi:hypothetical protein